MNSAFLCTIIAIFAFNFQLKINAENECVNGLRKQDLF